MSRFEGRPSETEVTPFIEEQELLLFIDRLGGKSL